MCGAFLIAGWTADHEITFWVQKVISVLVVLSRIENKWDILGHKTTSITQPVPCKKRFQQTEKADRSVEFWISQIIHVWCLLWRMNRRGRLPWHFRISLRIRYTLRSGSIQECIDHTIDKTKSPAWAGLFRQSEPPIQADSEAFLCLILISDKKWTKICEDIFRKTRRRTPQGCRLARTTTKYCGK